MKTEIQKIIVAKLLSWSLSICPNGEFKIKLAQFFFNNIEKL